MLPVLFTALAISACGGSGAADTTGPVTPPVVTGPVATSSVAISNLSFSPSAIVVPPGTAVGFTNNDGIAHNVTFSDATIGTSGDFTSGTQSLTMPAAVGTYNYHCTIHAGMTGTVQVK